MSHATSIYTRQIRNIETILLAQEAKDDENVRANPKMEWELSTGKLLSTLTNG